jgi:stage III sporulation protein AG
MTGVGKTEVLLTYSETSSISPLYNESTSSSTTTDSDGSTTETKTESKDVFTDGNSEAVLEKKTMPKLEGAIVIAEGAGDSVVKTNIIEAVEAVTGLLSHKVQVFEMKKDN